MIGNILGVIGVILTIAFGIYSIWVYKKSKLKVNLDFKNKECYGLFRDEVNRLNIEIKYNNNPLTNPLILLKAKLINTGHLDIDKNRIYNPLKIKSTDEFKWLESRITYSPKGSTTNIKINNPNELQLDWDLLKTEESIEIEALVDVSSGSKVDFNRTNEFFNGLKFDFRITDLNHINKEKQVSKKSTISIFRHPKLFGSIVALVGFVFTIGQFFPQLNFLPEKYNVEYKLSNENSSNHAIISAKNESKLKITPINSDKFIEMSVNDFNKKYKIEQIEKTSRDETDNFFMKILGIVYFVMGLAFLTFSFYLDNKKKKRKLGAEIASH